MDATRHGPSHPVSLVATATLLVNDWVLKAMVPGFVTGKLSDVAWLVVGPVVLAAVLVRLRVPERRARHLSLGLVAVAFTALQLVPVLGDTWAGLLGGRHVADPQDLLALPALLLVPLCWRRPVRPIPLVLPVSALACLATSWGFCNSYRLPADGAVDVDPNGALILAFGRDEVAYDSAAVLPNVRLREVGVGPVRLVAAGAWNRVALCPVGGLKPDTAYAWTVDDLETASANHLGAPNTVPTGRWTFRTGTSSAGLPVQTEADCRALAFDAPACEDTGDFDSGDTGAR